VSPHVSVIVLNYNGRRWLEPCLSALIAQSGAPSYEIVLADNGSNDGSLALVASRFPSVRIVDNGGNLGFAGGNNAAARAARGAVFAFLNNDTIPDPDWLMRLHAALAQPGRSLVTSKLVFLEGAQTIDSAGDGYLRAGGAFKRGHGLDAAAYGTSEEVFGACGAAFAIDRRLFEALGGFDADFFMVYEDVDLSYRARLAGHSCWYAADAVVRHAGSGTLGAMSEAAVFYGQRNLEWTFLKNTPRGLLWRTLPSHLLYSAAGVIHYAVRGRGIAAIHGKLAALSGLPTVLAKRRALQDAVKVDRATIERRLTRGWMTLKRAEKGRLRPG
jgi:GT2 family glycosyltransferase